MPDKPTYEELQQRVKDLEQTKSEYERTKKILKQNDEQFNRLFHGLADPVFIFRNAKPNTFLDCNQAAVEKYGYSRDEILKMGPQDLHLSNDLKEVNKNILNDAVIPHEYVHIAKDQTQFFVNIHSRKIKYNGEDAQISIVRDITEQKRTETALRNSEDRLTNIIEFLPDATFVIDHNKEVIAWNKALEIMTDTPKKDIIGKRKPAYSIPFYGKIRPTVADLVEEKDIDLNLYNSIEREKNCLVVETFVPKLFNGKGAYVWAIASPFYDKNGRFLGTIESIRDITEQRETQAQLSKYRNHLEALIDERTAELKQEVVHRRLAEKGLDTIIKTVPDIIYRLDVDGKITFISDAVKQYGYTPESLLGKPMIDLVYHEDRGKAKDRLKERRTRGRRTSSFEVRLLTKDQENVPFEIFSVSAEGLYSSDSPTRDTFMGTQGIARDITERKRAEEERENLITDLQDALENVKILSGLVPICANCKKIRDDKGYWNGIEDYIQKYSEVIFSHGMCPECSEELYGDQDWYLKVKKKKSQDKS